MFDIYYGFVLWLILWLPEWTYVADAIDNDKDLSSGRVGLFWDCIVEDRVSESPWSYPSVVFIEMDGLRDENRIKILKRRVKMRLIKLQ